MGRLTRRTKDHLGRTGIAVGVHDVYKYSPHYDAMEKLAHYEDMEEQGKLIELPCKPYEMVWEAHGRYPTGQTTFCCNAHIIETMEAGYGIGYTKEEAEAKLKELEGE